MHPVYPLYSVEHCTNCSKHLGYNLSDFLPNAYINYQLRIFFQQTEDTLQITKATWDPFWNRVNKCPTKYIYNWYCLLT